MLTKIVSFLIFVLIWLGLAGIHSKPQLIVFSLMAPFLAVAFAIKLKLLPKKNGFNLGALSYLGWLVKEVVMSAIAVSKIAWRKDIVLRPVLAPIKTIQNKNLGIVIYANSITLTPGTVTLSIEGENLLIHALDAKSVEDLQQGEMDNRIKKIIN
ncbi:MAG: Na+/H+ antiporter subunit E [Rickettsiaceae bacterium]